MYTYTAGSKGTFAGAPSGMGLGAVDPAVAGPVRLAEIEAALKATAGYPAIQNQLLVAKANAASGSIAAAERSYMAARSQAMGAGIGSRVPPLKAITADGGDGTKIATDIMTSITEALEGAFSPAKTTTTPPGSPAPKPSGGVVATPGKADVKWTPDYMVRRLRDPRGALFEQYGPLKAWQWAAVAGGGLIVASMAVKALKFAVAGGALAAGAYGMSWFVNREYQRKAGA